MLPVIRAICLGALANFALGFVLTCFSGGKVEAAEDGKSIYLLGIATSQAGIVPPPGSYGASYNFFYTGSSQDATVGNSVLLPDSGRIDTRADIDLDVDLFFTVPTYLWVAPRKLLNGRFGFAGLVPMGWQDISVDVDINQTLTTPGGDVFERGQQLAFSDDTVNFGDPLFIGFIGWNRGNLHWKLEGLLNIPIGAFDKDNLANNGFNRWAFDMSGAVTWLDPSAGFEVTTKAGFTFNGENPDTDYKTGTEFHVEYAVMKNLSKDFAIGVVGYNYQQLTGDSGEGAVLGAFKGRTNALGPQINYNFKVRGHHVTTQLRWLREYAVDNRTKGDAVFLQAAVPLGSH